VTFPNDPYLVPFLIPEEAANPAEGAAPSRVTSELLQSARMIQDAGERSMALQRIANGAIASDQMILAHHTLEEAVSAASNVTVPLVRDQRLIALVYSLNALTDALLRKDRTEPTRALEAEAAEIEALPKRPESTVLVRMARLEWRRAVYLASVIGNPTYRNEMLYRVAESEASGSATIANEYVLAPEQESLGNRPGPGRAAADRKDRETYRKLADTILVEAWDVAKKIDRLIWKNRAMVRIALSASDSGQQKRGVELSRGIPNAESRAEALLLLAESQCRHDQGEAATATYQAAVEAVASIQQAGLRGVIAGILIDNLIAAGRFEDARLSVVVYPEESDRFVALSLIAEAQGRRGRAESARRWIATEAPEGYRPALYRRVAAGVLWAVEQERNREFLRGDTLPGR
jgi:hypothetical protein